MRLTPMLGSAKRLPGDHGPVLVYLASPLQSASAVIGVGTGKSLRSRVVGPFDFRSVAGFVDNK